MEHQLPVTEGALRSTSRADAVFRAVTEGIATFTASDLTVTSVNPSITRIFGYAPQDIVGQPISVLLDDDDHAEPRATDTHALDLTGRRADGSSFPLEMTIVAADVTSDPFYVATFRDVGERRRLDRMKDEFIANLTHELRTPLTAIVSALDMADLASKGHVASEAKNIAEIGRRNSQRLIRLIDDVLDLAELTSGAAVLDMRQHDVSTIAEEALSAAQGWAEDFGVSLARERDLASASVNVDRGRLAQALRNLLSNAAKWSPLGGAVTVDVRRSQGEVRVCVTDEGAGIDAEYQLRVFDAFYQADASSTRDRGGSGLGLTISKVIVELMGGRIGLESVVGEGSTFWVALPEYDGSDGVLAPTALDTG